MKFLLSHGFALSILLFPLFSEAGPAIPEKLMKAGCGDLEMKSCRLASTQKCEAIYVASSNATPECQLISKVDAEVTCGVGKPLFPSRDCTGRPATGEGKAPESGSKPVARECPSTSSSLQLEDLENIHLCKDLHASLCKELCGPRYDFSQIRNFTQTGRKPGLTCIDGSHEDVKNGMKYEDSLRTGCSETHGEWCISYNRSANSVNYAAFVQCVGKLKPPSASSQY